MTGRSWVGIGLLGLAGLMFIGFLGSSRAIGSLATIGALLITVALPALGGIALIRGVGGRDRARRHALRQTTIDAEVMKLAVEHAGKLTAIEVATALALTPEESKTHLDAMVEREIADLEITDHGVIVYTFHEAKHIGDKATSRGVLDD